MFRLRSAIKKNDEKYLHCMSEKSFWSLIIYINFTISGAELNNQLDHWLSKAELSYGPARGIIAVIFALNFYINSFDLHIYFILLFFWQ